jgi:hypothetical protein
MSSLSKVFWSWCNGSVMTELFYSDNTEKKFYLSKPPPTTPEHDIAHFICGFHPNLDWDFSLEPNHIAEYNAVFMEHLLLLFYRYPDIDDENLQIQVDGVYEYMRWFSEDYYKIDQTLDAKYTSEYLKKNFLDNLDPLISSKFYKQFYSATYLVEEYKLKQNEINIQLTFDEKSAMINQNCCNFLSRVQNLGN